MYLTKLQVEATGKVGKVGKVGMVAIRVILSYGDDRMATIFELILFRWKPLASLERTERKLARAETPLR